jgi:hypothetical protein
MHKLFMLEDWNGQDLSTDQDEGIKVDLKVCYWVESCINVIQNNNPWRAVVCVC